MSFEERNLNETNAWRLQWQE